MESFVPMSAEDFLFHQLKESVQVTHVAILQQGVEQHRAQRRAKRDRQACFHAVAQPAVHDLDQWQVAFGDRLEKPVLLEEIFVLRMPDKRQMSMENKREIAVH